MLLSRMSSAPKTSVGRTIVCESPSPGRALAPAPAAEVRVRRVGRRVRDAHVDNAANARAGGGVE